MSIASLSIVHERLFQIKGTGARNYFMNSKQKNIFMIMVSLSFFYERRSFYIW